MRLIKVKADPTGGDSVAERKFKFGQDRDLELLKQCETLWENLRYFRRSRERALRFTYGDQWADMITVNGETMKERDYISKVGNVALQTNQIKKIVSTIVGVWTNEHNEPQVYARDRNEQTYAEVISETLKANWQRNRMSVVLGSCYEDVLEGGFIASRECWDKRDMGDTEDFDAWTDAPNPNYMFFDAGMKDARFHDLSLVGEIHDVTFNELCHKFARNPEDFKKLREWFTDEANPLKDHDMIDVTDKNSNKGMTFYTPRDTKLCRVFEIWTKERRLRYKLWDKNDGTTAYCDASDSEYLKMVKETNRIRKESAPADWSEEEIPYIYGYDKKYVDQNTGEEYDGQFYDTFWYYRFMTPLGYVIDEGESQNPDRSHPYTLLAVPFTNGRISSYINDAIDQNKAINRILTLDDWIRRAGAKGVTFVPENIIPPDMDYKTFAEQWTSIDGIVYYKPNQNGDMPKTFYGNVGTLNTPELVRMLNDLMESSVSVSGAVQGKTPYAGTSAALYAQQAQQSSNPIALLKEKFNAFVEDVAIKKAKYIKANYTPERYAEIAGKLEIPIENLDLTKTGNIQYDLAIKQSVETPTSRMLFNDTLDKWVQIGLIPLEDALDVGMFPGGDKLSQRIKARQQAAMAQQAAQGAPVE